MLDVWMGSYLKSSFPQRKSVVKLPAQFFLSTIITLVWMVKQFRFKYALNTLHFFCPWDAIWPGCSKKDLSLFSHISVATFFVYHKRCCIHSFLVDCLYCSQDQTASIVEMLGISNHWARYSFKLKFSLAYWETSGKSCILSCSIHYHVDLKALWYHPGYTILSQDRIQTKVQNLLE